MNNFLPSSYSDIVQTFTAISTLLAVIVSLVLGFRHSKPKLRVTADIRIMVQLGDPNPSAEVIAFSISNVGPVPAKLQSVSWSVGPMWMVKIPFLRVIAQRFNLVSYFFQITSQAADETRLPHMLEIGEQAFLYIPKDAFFTEENKKNMFKKMVKNRRVLKTVRVHANFVFPIEVSSKLDKALLKEIWKFGKSE